MSKNTFSLSLVKHLSLCLIVIVAVFFSLARAQDSTKSDADKTTFPALSEVEPKYVCMVNDQLYENEQIPVTVDGKTYYGCCEMCKTRLMNDRDSRESRDPISGKVVDKALSLTGAATDGSVYYFENEENLKKFKENMSRE